MAKERVQVQGLGGQVPGIQPTIQRAGQYSVGQRRAGRNKLMDLADALSQVNPILQQYGNIRRVEQERQRVEQEAREKEGYRAYQTSPATMAVQLQKTQNKIRASVERGEIPDEANVPFLLGAMKAKSEVLVNRDYRNILMNPELLESDIDPIVEVARQREEFLKRAEFESPSVRDHAFKYLEKVENEFIGTVQNRLAAFEVEEGKQNWLNNGKNTINNVIAGKLDINDDSVKEWLNDPAALFKGSRKYAWDNGFKEALKEGLTSGTVSPTQAVTFIKRLRELDLGNGAKFADAETGNAISDFFPIIENQRAAWEKRGQDENAKIFKEQAGITADLLDKARGVGDTVPSEDVRKIRELYLENVPKHLRVEARGSFNDILKDINAVPNDSTKLIAGKLETFIDQGLDLDNAKDEVESAFLTGPSKGGITLIERNRLLKKIEDSRDFVLLIEKDDFYVNIIKTDEELITGFSKEKALYGKGTYEVGYFLELAKEDVSNGVYGRIHSLKGKPAARQFVNMRYNAYEQQFRKAFKAKFARYEQDPAFTPEQAKERIREESQEIRDQVFTDWERESVNIANESYGSNINMPLHLRTVSGSESLGIK